MSNKIRYDILCGKQSLPDWCNRERSFLGLSKSTKNNIRYYQALYQATPIWFEKESVKKFYKKAQQFGFTVDHIVPLRNKCVCGLHCYHNLQVLELEINLSKSNHHWPDMWEEQIDLF